jgi:hypothetical protein
MYHDRKESAGASGLNDLIVQVGVPQRLEGYTEQPRHQRGIWTGKMTTLSPDTPPDVERLQIEQLRRMPAWRKLALMGEMIQTVNTLALSGLRQRHPNDTPTQRRRRLADLILGTELAARVYGPPPGET